VSPRGRIAFLLSGSGRLLEALLGAIDAGGVPGDVVLVVADRPGAEGVATARRRGIPVAVVHRRAYADRAAFSAALEAALRPHGADLVVMAGFHSLFRIPSDLTGRVLNLHPGLLPESGGEGRFGSRVHREVLASGRAVTGCTVHVATDEVHAGAVLDSVRVPVAGDDTPESLGDRVARAEEALLPRAVADLLTGRVAVVHGEVRRREAGAGPPAPPPST
jgi:phosphoribosylglycinamide formyltransferase-1